MLLDIMHRRFAAQLTLSVLIELFLELTTLFFPPQDAAADDPEGKWSSCESNYKALHDLGLSKQDLQKIVAGNASRLLEL
mmetsp:Transcript_225/g.208  ORF Transcript_225/g.208 Transcript_225/m.208 type:complete len:80 (-) Transcript_225:78-317(-)